MADISKINLSGAVYNIKDATARANLNEIQNISDTEIDEITDFVLESLPSSYVYGYETAAAMQADLDLQIGMIAHTNGFTTSGDGNAAYYTISNSGVADGTTILALQNGLKAIKVSENNSIAAADIQDNAITTTKIVDGSITANKLANDAVNAMPTMTTSSRGVAKVGAGLAVNNGALELDGSGDIATAVTSWLNAHSEATTTVSDGSITLKKLNDSVQKLVRDSSQQFGIVKFEPGWVNIANDVTSLDPGNMQIRDVDGTVKHAIIECQQGDIFEVDLLGGSSAKQYALIAGANYETPYAILARCVGAFQDIRTRTIVVINNPDVKYILFNNKFAVNPQGFVRKLERDEYLSMRSKIDASWLKEHCQVHRAYLDLSGNYYYSSGYDYSPYIPVKYGDIIEGSLAGNGNCCLCSFYDKNMTFLYPICGGTEYNVITDFSFIVPVDGYIRLSYYFNWDYKDESQEWAYNLFKQYRIRITPTEGRTNSEILSNSYDALEYLRNSRKIYGDFSPLSLLHFSDIHGDTPRLREIAAALNDNRLSNHVDDAICTGDLVYQNISNSTDFLRYASLYKYIMLCIGNHDVKSATGSYYKYDNNVTIPDTYTRFFGDMSSWGVTTNSLTDYPTYYRKDYPSSGIRLIVLDGNMDANLTPDDYAKQMNWLTDSLDDARTNSLAVVIAQHFPIQGTPNIIQCNFSDLASIAYTSMGNDSYNQSTIEEFQSRVQDFIDAGGEFVCWLCGHNHADFVYTVQQYPDQLCVVVGLASTRVSTSLTDRSVGKSKHLWNVVTFQRGEHQIRIIRFGADKTKYMTSKKAICIDYQTKQVIAQT